jgi:NADPH:quinone reductase-like Zn-dependent oxidoreductase
MILEMIEQIAINYTVPIYWLIGGAASVGVLAIQLWATVKMIVTKVDTLEKEINELKQMRDDVAYIRGKISKL